MRRLPEPLRKSLVVVHIITAAGLIGADLVLVLLGFAGANGAAPRTVYPAAYMVGVWVVLPLALTAIGSGLLLGVFTRWGLFRHGWVVAKLAITTGLLVAVLAVLLPGLHAAAAAAAGPYPMADLPGRKLALGPLVALGLLTINVALAVYRPARLRIPGAS